VAHRPGAVLTLHPGGVPVTPERSLWHPNGWALHSRIVLALFTVGALLIGVVAASALLQVQTRESQQEVISDYYTALRVSQNYLIRMIDSETAIRGYALSHDRNSLQPLTQAGQPWETPISPQIAAVLPEQKALLARLREIETASMNWYRQWGAPSIQKIDAGQSLTAADIQAGTVLFDRVRSAYDGYLVVLRTRRDTAAGHLQWLTNLLFAAVIAIALIAIIGGVLLWQLIRRWFSQPVAHLAAEARTVSAGDLAHRVTAVGPQEFVQLGADVEAMRQSLVAQIAAVEEAGREVSAARVTLEEQTLELQRSNRELEQFAYVASHDLQEPLRKVASFCQMLERRYAGQLDERADQYIHFAVDGAKRMQQLINDLLEFSRVGRLSNPRVDVPLTSCLRLALSNLEAAREESGAEVTWDDLPTVLGEAPLLTQLLQNLLGNAIKFRSTEPPRIHLGVRRDGEFWEFSCSDNGIGIEPEYAERVFLIFQRLHPKEVYTGTGIGLAMCKKIVEHHGGRIWLDASPGPGTTVRWTLPTAASEPPPNGRILLAEPADPADPADPAKPVDPAARPVGSDADEPTGSGSSAASPGSLTTRTS
jgi:signal transduction histidine kinase